MRSTFARIPGSGIAKKVLGNLLRLRDPGHEPLPPLRTTIVGMKQSSLAATECCLGPGMRRILSWGIPGAFTITAGVRCKQAVQGNAPRRLSPTIESASVSCFSVAIDE